MHLLQIAIKDTMPQSNLIEKIDAHSINIWTYIAIVEFLIIILLVIYLFYLKRRQTVSKFEKEIREAKNTDIDMDDLMLSINKSRELYKELSRKCHPDKHINSEFQKEIEELFQEITKNKRNFQELVKLKDIAINKYNIKMN
jgi:biopolymer transport protein ExbB/TolQ